MPPVLLSRRDGASQGMYQHTGSNEHCRKPNKYRVLPLAQLAEVAWDLLTTIPMLGGFLTNMPDAQSAAWSPPGYH